MSRAGWGAYVLDGNAGATGLVAPASLMPPRPAAPADPKSPAGR